MTVIAWDGKLLASDTRMTSADSTLYSDNCQKLFEMKIPDFGNCVVGISGKVLGIGPWKEHLADEGLTKCDNPNVDNGGIALNRKGKCIEFDSDGGWYEVGDHTAIGSGALLAEHYLFKGADAITAIRETCKTELSCGGSIVVYDFKKHTFEQITL